eukprot:g6076.t1
MEQAVGLAHPRHAGILHNRAGSLKAQGTANEAWPISLRALTIRKRKVGEGHEDTTLTSTALKELGEGDRVQVERPK